MKASRVAAAALVLAAMAGAPLPGPAGEPVLPAGLDPATEPTLPRGLGVPASVPLAPVRERSAWILDGFWEARLGGRLGDDPHQTDGSLRETRLQTRLSRHDDSIDLRLVTDLVYDNLAETQSVDLERGNGFVDLREANLVLRLRDNADLKLGRQILTWGTGDLVFINDRFPKDYRAFFLGRDESYLKAPSDAARLSLSAVAVNLDLVYTPRFSPDRYIDGSRLSFYNPLTGGLSGRDAVTPVRHPRRLLTDDEWAGRLYGELGATQWAWYGYSGFWKSPLGVSADGNTRSFPRLRVLGASLEGALAGGIGNLELGWYDSLDDRDGGNALIPNGELRLLAGYRRELLRDIQLGLQYNMTRMRHHDAYLKTLPGSSPVRKRTRHQVSLRLDWRLLRQDLRLSLFGFYSPSDRDSYVRGVANYRADDHWALEGGLNLFHGQHEHTFFGQLRDNSNGYLGVRYHFDAGGV